MNDWGLPNRHNADEAAADAAIREVLHRYCWCIDAFDDDLLLELFTPDGEWWRAGEEPLRGRSQIAGFLRARDGAVAGRHIASNIVIDMDGPAQAKVASYYTVFRAGADGGPVATNMGEYHDVFRLDQGRWRIARRETRRVFRVK